MIVSFHPLFEADQNIICAGRDPDASDMAAIKAADAVILPQGCQKKLYEMTHHACEHVFPNYSARFHYPGKIGQIQLFRDTHTPHPQTEIFASIKSFYQHCDGELNRLAFQFPFVFKFDWGGEGDTVYFIPSFESLQKIVQQAEIYEKSGQHGFMIQQYVPHHHKTLRVVIIGEQLITYWRVQENPKCFLTNLSKGAILEFEADPDLQSRAISSVKRFCGKSKINLAGVDVIFSSGENVATPQLLEVNYYFGRKGLGGSQGYYKLLQEEIQRWLDRVVK
jgi:ribosomal protein S6--L-glutamate ligase